jgi:hypothetical protein
MTEKPSRQRRPTSWLARAYGVLGAGVIAAYLWLGWTGWEPERAARGIVPQGVRSSPGGYRSFHFWHTGFHGGK